MYAATRLKMDWGALAVGVALAALSVVGWQVDGGSTAPAARVALVTASAPELALEPAGITTERKALRPSGPENGLERRLTVSNATAAPTRVSLRASAASTDLDDVLAVRVTAGGERVFHGTLARFQRGTRGFALASHASTEVAVVAWIPADSVDGWQARAANVRLELVSDKA